jgi:hypothetical protein
MKTSSVVFAILFAVMLVVGCTEHPMEEGMRFEDEPLRTEHPMEEGMHVDPVTADPTMTDPAFTDTAVTDPTMTDPLTDPGDPPRR